MPVNRYPIARTRSFFIPAVYSSWNVSSKTDSPWGMQCPASSGVWVWGWGRLPSDYVSALQVWNVVISNASGYARLQNRITIAGEGDAPDDQLKTVGPTTVEIGDETQEHVLNIDLTTLTFVAGDIIRCEFERDGSHVEDTLSASLYVAGWLFSYLADM